MTTTPDEPRGPTGETGATGPPGAPGQRGERGESSPDFVRLITTIDGLSRDIHAHKSALAAADRRSRWARTVAVVGICVGILGVAVGMGGAIFGLNAQTTADDVSQARRDNLVSGCVQANITTQRTRAALVAGVSVLTTLNPDRTAEQQANVDEFVDRYTTSVERALPYRSCSPEGIAAYYDHPPVDPATIQTSSTTNTRGDRP